MKSIKRVQQKKVAHSILTKAPNIPVCIPLSKWSMWKHLAIFLVSISVVYSHQNLSWTLSSIFIIISNDRVSVILYCNQNTTIFTKILESERKVWQLKTESLKAIGKISLCEVSFSLNVRLSICSHK